MTDRYYETKHGASYKQLTLTLLAAFFASITILLLSQPFLYAGAVILLTYIVICMVRPFLGLLVYLFVAFHSQLVNLRVMGLVVDNVLLLALLFGSTINFFVNLRAEMKNECGSLASFKYLVPFFLSLVSVSLFNGIDRYTSVIYYCAGVIIPLMILWAKADSIASIEAVFKALFMSAIAMSLFGLFEVGAGRTFFYSAWTLTERYRFGIIRMGSTAGDPNYICFYIIPLIPLGLYFYRKATNSRARYAALLGTVILVATSIMTFSRIGYLSLLIILSFFSYGKLAKRIMHNKIARIYLMLTFLLITGLTLVKGYDYLSSVFSGALGSSKTRIKALLVSMDHIGQHPFAGLGYMKLEAFNARYVHSPLTPTGGVSAMNSYVKIMAENGVITGIAFLLVVVLSYRNIVRMEKNHDIYLYIRCSFIVWLIIAATLDSYGTVAFWALVGASLWGKHLPHQPACRETPCYASLRQIV